MSEQNWLDDLADPDDGDGSGASASLFEDNFRTMVEENDVESMNLDALEDQIDRISDIELLADAIEVDSRKGGEELYRQRIGELNAEKEAEDDAPDEVEADEAEEASEEDEGEEAADESVDSEDAEPVVEDDESEDDQSPSEDAETSQESAEAPENPATSGSDLPDVDVDSIAPSAVSRESAVERVDKRTLMVWSEEGLGKSHIGQSAPAPVCVIDTEGKASELAAKFDKRIHYFEPTNYEEARAALDEALALLEAYLEEGHRGTIVVDSLSKIWEWSKIDYAEWAYQTDDLTEVNFKSALQGEQDWEKIRARHATRFRDVILNSPFHVVFTAVEKDAYGEVFADGSVKKEPDGEKFDPFSVKEVVRLRTDADGKTVGDLYKAARTRYSFIGLEWPEWDSIYEAIDEITAAELAPEPVDVDDWEFDVVDGQPLQGIDEEEDEDDE